MTNVTRLRHALPMSPEINKAVTELDIAIAKAIDAVFVDGSVTSLFGGNA